MKCIFALEYIKIYIFFLLGISDNWTSRNSVETPVGVENIRGPQV